MFSFHKITRRQIPKKAKENVTHTAHHHPRSDPIRNACAQIRDSRVCKGDASMHVSKCFEKWREKPHPTKNTHFRNYRINEKQRIINEPPPGRTDLNASRRFAKNLLPTILER